MAGTEQQTIIRKESGMGEGFASTRSTTKYVITLAAMEQDILIENQRAQAILRELLRDGNITVEQMAQTFDVSVSSIRRDLRELERAGLLRRTRGGAVLVEPMLYEPFRHLSSFGELEQRCAAEKRRIGLAAAEMIGDGEIVSIGAGTTTTHVARGIRHRKNITVVTNALNIAMELSHRSDLKIFMPGGLLSSDWFALIGAAAIQNISAMFVDKIFIGADGIHPQHGLTTNYPDQAAIHSQMLKQSRYRVIVADHGKFNVTCTALICPLDGINLLITDKGATKAMLAPFLNLGVKIETV
ncbi:MAG TPA: DeoR/GlpR family DNA-binding transcription regulator [Pyrinomonadaceae bacterium]|nr:DeoR/GlpR family DNA-binding transcription regulator [Pyrinomonadaceae bacterium]